MILSAAETYTSTLSDLPCPVATELLHKSPSQVSFAGDLQLLARETIALFCSSQCPGAAILCAIDRMTQLRDAGKIVLGGFHSPMEQDCLRILLRGQQPIVIVLARTLHNLRLAPELAPAFQAKRLLFLSPFDQKHKRATAALAAQRNRFAAAIANKVLFAYAAPGSRTATLAAEVRRTGKMIETLS